MVVCQRSMGCQRGSLESWSEELVDVLPVSSSPDVSLFLLPPVELLPSAPPADLAGLLEPNTDSGSVLAFAWRYSWRW